MTLIHCVKSEEEAGYRLEIWERDDGFFQFVESQQVKDAERSFWSPITWSGIYPTAAAAEREAFHILLWMSDRDRRQTADP